MIESKPLIILPNEKEYPSSKTIPRKKNAKFSERKAAKTSNVKIPAYLKKTIKTDKNQLRISYE